jgi:hypothetical protein
LAIFNNLEKDIHPGFKLEKGQTDMVNERPKETPVTG